MSATPAADIFNAYWAALLAKDDDALSALITDDMVIEGPLTKYSGREAYMQGVKTVQQFARWIEPIHQSEANGAVVTVYRFHIGPPAREGSVLVAELSVTLSNRIKSTHMIFDGQEMLALLPEGVRPPPK